MSKPLAILAIVIVLVAISAAGTSTAATCNSADVQTAINASSAGDIVIVPPGTCIWNSTVTISASITLQGSGTPNTTPTQFGAGTLTTIIKDNIPSAGAIQAAVTYSPGALLHITTLDIEPINGSTSLASPVQVAGTCTGSGCPQIRIDNVAFGATTQWTEGGNGSSADWMIRVDNAFGVIDHNTLPSGSQVELINANLSAYLGVGDFGDNSWATPDSFGSANVLYVENNSLFFNQAVGDCDVAPAGDGVGGCRIAARFNQATFQGAFAFLIPHGLDTDGRPQGGRQLEAYGNTIACPATSNVECDGVIGYRSGTGFTFGNTLTNTTGAFWKFATTLTVYRAVYTATSGWGACGGSSPYDTNDGTVYYSGTTSTSGTTLTDGSKTWTTNQFIPNGAPYSVRDVTQGWWAEIAGNTATTLTIATSIPEQANTFTNGDSYQILRATVCADQGGRGQGALVSGTPPSPSAALSQTLDPIYEWNDSVTGVGGFNGGNNMGAETLRTIANRDWYTDASNGSPQAQTSATSPFNGTSGVGFGTLARRPTTCASGVGYFATDQGTWNTSGNGFGQGVLYTCGPSNTWTTHYTPYTYPHPLISGGGGGGGTTAETMSGGTWTGVVWQ